MKKAQPRLSRGRSVEQIRGEHRTKGVALAWHANSNDTIVQATKVVCTRISGSGRIKILQFRLEKSRF